jgi:hypothetical protein
MPILENKIYLVVWPMSACASFPKFSVQVVVGREMHGFVVLYLAYVLDLRSFLRKYSKSSVTVRVGFHGHHWSVRRGEATVYAAQLYSQPVRRTRGWQDFTIS